MRHEPHDRVDHYEILEALGEGASAQVYKAKDVLTGQTVVLKCPDPLLLADPGLFQRYQRELEIAQRLDHPGVQRSMDPGGTRTEQYLVLEYVDGGNLRQVLDGEGPVPVDQAVDWGRQLADAIAYLHQAGIVHRDLKPENVLVAGDGRLKVADFGTALLEGSRRLTWKHLHDGLGTPYYMSPEQVQGERGDQRSDIYAWGVMMYELLAGRPPFGGDNWMATMAGHLQGTPRPLRRVRADVPAGLEAIVLHAMRRYPEHRYERAEDIVLDLDHLARGDVPSYDTSPEPPMGAAVPASTERIWLYAVLVAVGFVAAVALIITLEVVLR